MKKALLGVFSAITIVSGASLAWGQADEPKPCSPIPQGCWVTKGCECQMVNGVKICTDEYQCGPINP